MIQYNMGTYFIYGAANKNSEKTMIYEWQTMMIGTNLFTIRGTKQHYDGAWPIAIKKETTR